MKKTVIGFLTVSLLYCGVVLAQSMGAKGLHFVAPAIWGDPDVVVSIPEPGEIVFRADISTFKGFNGTSWVTMDNTTAIVPAGVVSAFAGSSAPTGYFLCNGQAVSRTLYADLFAAIGTTYGAGDGSTTFNVPDLRGIFVRGAGSQTISSETYSGTLAAKQNDATSKNGLSISDPGHQHITAVNGGAGSNPNGWGSNGGLTGFNGAATVSNNGAVNTSSSTTGISMGAGDSETRPANMALNYIIKY